MSPFPFVYHYDPLSPPDLALFQILPLWAKSNERCAKPCTKSRAGRKYAISWVTKFKHARELIQQAKYRMSDIANSKQTNCHFEVVDFVVLNKTTFKLIKPSPAEKFLPSVCGPYRVSHRISFSACKLILPPTCKIHRVVYVMKLWKYTFRSNELKHHPPVLLENPSTIKVLKILSHRGSPKIVST